MYKFYKIINKNLFLFICSPIILNYLINIFNNKFLLSFSKNSFIKLSSLALGSIFLFYVADVIKSTFYLDSYSLSIVYFLTSFFVVDSIFLPITKHISFEQLFYLVVFAWLILLLRVKKNNIKILKVFVSYIVWRIFNKVFLHNLLNLENYKELNTDVTVQWFLNAEMIYNNNYYFGLGNNLISGQGLLPSYVQSLILQIGFNLENFIFVQTTINLLWFISILAIIDLKIDNINKILLAITYTILILNNKWLNYLLNDSLMIEGIVSLFIAIYLMNYNFQIKSENTSSYLFFLFFGSMCLSKNFVSILVILILILNLLNIKRIKKAFLGISIFLFNIIYQKIYFTNVSEIPYTNEINFTDLILDFLFFRDIDLANIIKIIQQIWIDKPFTFLFLIFILLNIYSLLKKTTVGFNQKFIFYFVLLNFLLVNLLYVSYWRNVELESSYRYIIETFHLILLNISINASELKKNI